MVIALTGFMGSGKTTVGRILSDALGCPFADLDDVVASAAGKTIPDIFASEGESGFRKREVEALRKVLSKYASGTAVLALGGGLVTSPAAPALLREKTLCIYLQAGFDTLWAHLEGNCQDRPLATSPEALQALLEQRLPLYEAASEVTLPTDGLSPEEIADEIIISVL